MAVLKPDEWAGYLSQVGFKLKDLRQAKGLSGSQMGEFFKKKVSAATISRMESGDVSLEEMLVYSYHLDKPLVEFLNVPPLMTEDMMQTFGDLSHDYKTIAVTVLNALWQQCYNSGETQKQKEAAAKKKKAKTKKQSTSSYPMGYMTTMSKMSGNMWGDFVYPSTTTDDEASDEPKKPRFVLIDSEDPRVRSKADAKRVEAMIFEWDAIIGERSADDDSE